jgi:hypothetical protein
MMSKTTERVLEIVRFTVNTTYRSGILRHPQNFRLPNKAVFDPL